MSMKVRWLHNTDMQKLQHLKEQYQMKYNQKESLQDKVERCEKMQRTAQESLVKKQNMKIGKPSMTMKQIDHSTGKPQAALGFLQFGGSETKNRDKRVHRTS